MLENAVVYDCECFPNFFSLHMEMLNSEVSSTWEISQYRDDRNSLFDWFNWLNRTQSPMIGFNNLHYDYQLIHYLYTNPQATFSDLYTFSQNIINNNDRFGGQIWANDRFAPQVDLLKVYHFDNLAKRTNLKALQINMRSRNVVESAVPFGTWLIPQQIESDVIPYNKHDVKETKKFALLSMTALNFRAGIVDQFGIDCLNWNDTKIGENILIKRIGNDVCYKRGPNGMREKQQTFRSRIALTDVVFPYISFSNPEFERVRQYMLAQVLTPDEFFTDEGDSYYGDNIKTKGVFKGLKAHIAGVDYYFGTGGIHASVSAQHVKAEGNMIIRDIDVAALYPSIGIVNKLYPEHLGEAFVSAYAELPKERKEWQKKKGKKCVEANSLKLGSNGAYGKSNDKFSVLFDPLFTMRITINGQLMIAMLVERLVTVPTLQIIQANTDGITYRIDKNYEQFAAQHCKQWEAFTMLVLESVDYSDMWIRDVNNYIARGTDGTLKQKGAYWHPESGEKYAQSISEQQPPAWHKDLGNLVSIKAAVAAMVYGVNPELFIRMHTDPFDFMKRIKVGRADVLLWGDLEMQRNSRYYVARNGLRLVKSSPPAKGAKIGDYKRANGVPDRVFNEVSANILPDSWDERIHTKNRSRYEIRETQIEAGQLVDICNNADNFRFDNVNYEYYIAEAKKLIIG